MRKRLAAVGAVTALTASLVGVGATSASANTSYCGHGYTRSALGFVNNTFTSHFDLYNSRVGVVYHYHNVWHNPYNIVGHNDVVGCGAHVL